MEEKNTRKWWRQERGGIIVLFALSLVTLLSFVSLAIDIGMVNMKRAAMMDLCQQIRKARLDAKEYIMYAKDPALMIYQISNECAKENGFQGGLRVYYKEDTDPATPTSAWVDRRTYTTRIELRQNHQFSFVAALFSGPASQEIKVSLDGGEEKTSGPDEAEEKKVPVWHPGKEKTKTGYYERKDITGEASPSKFVQKGW